MSCLDELVHEGLVPPALGKRREPEPLGIGTPESVGSRQRASSHLPEQAALFPAKPS